MSDDEYKENHKAAKDFKDFTEERFIYQKTSPLLSKIALSLSDMIEKLPIHYKNQSILNLDKLKALKEQEQDSYMDFTNKYIQKFRNIAQSIDSKSDKILTYDKTLEEIIKAEKEKEEKKAERERENRDKELAHAEWVEANISPKVELVSSIKEAIDRAPKIDLASLAKEAEKETKQAGKFVVPSLGKILKKVSKIRSPFRKKGPQR